ncbi:MAG: NAD(P)-dependent alcohol dehydrogenase [Halioglobus sp.]
MEISAYAATESGKDLVPFNYDSGDLGPDEILVAITHCGICYSDVSFIDDHFGGTGYPLVAGHEVIGTVTHVGTNVDHLAVGQRVGVGPQCASCLNCSYCASGREILCSEKQLTIGGGNRGGFGNAMKVDANFAFAIPENLDSVNAAPLLCAGLTTYSPLAHHTRPGMRVGVIGIGGLGHLALQYANKMGLEVTALSSSDKKKEEAMALGAHHFVNTSDPEAMAGAVNSVDFILSTIYADLDWVSYMSLLRPDGRFCIVGASMNPIDMPAALLTVNQHHISGGAAGGRADMMEMLQFSSRHGITAKTEVMPVSEINAALEKVRNNEVRYRMVLEI